MSRWIEVEPFIKDIATIDGRRLSTASIGMAIDSAPSIDIVTCRECRHFNDHSIRVVDGDSRGVCRTTDRIVDADDFCSYGCREG